MQILLSKINVFPSSETETKKTLLFSPQKYRKNHPASSAQVMEAPVHVASGPLGGVTTTTRALDGQVQHV